MRLRKDLSSKQCHWWWQRQDLNPVYQNPKPYFFHYIIVFFPPPKEPPSAFCCKKIFVSIVRTTNGKDPNHSVRTQELRPCLPSPPCSASSVPSSVTPDHGSRHWVLVQSPRSSWAGRFSLSLSKRGNLKLDKVSRLQTVFPRILYPLRIFRGTLGVGQGPRKGQTQPEHRTYTSFSGTILIDKNLLYLT